MKVYYGSKVSTRFSSIAATKLLKRGLSIIFSNYNIVEENEITLTFKDHAHQNGTEKYLTYIFDRIIRHYLVKL